MKKRKLPKPKPRFPVPPGARPHVDKRKEENRSVCRKKGEKG